MTKQKFVMPSCFHSTRSLVLLIAGVAIAICSIPHPTAHSAPISYAALEWRIAAKEQVLIDSHDKMSMMGAMWDVPAQRRLERNMPWIEITNDSDSQANLTEFRMTIGDERFNFSNDVYPDYTAVSQGSDLLDITTTTANDDDELVVSFDGPGLAPGEMVRLRIAIGIDGDHPELAQVWPHPDYRTVLFDMNGIDAWGPSPMTPMPPDSSDNATAVGTFSSMGMTAVSDPTAFPDAEVVGPQATIFNQFFRPRHVMEDVDVFSAVQVVGVIPEPSSMMLAMLGMVAFGFVAQRRNMSCDRRAPATYRRQNDPRTPRQAACRHRMSQRSAK